MIELRLPDHPSTLRVLCLGAHADDVEIGASGTLRTLLAARPGSTVTWVVASAARERAAEAEASATGLLGESAQVDVRILGFTDGYLDRDGAALKDALLGLRTELPAPDLVLSHHADDLHQDHRTIAEITWQLWRDHLILGYEVPKWDGDMGRPNLYVPLTDEEVDRKLGHLRTHFASQRGKDWYDDETFRALMRLRGMECRAPSRYAEAFYVRKAVLGA